MGNPETRTFKKEQTPSNEEGEEYIKQCEPEEKKGERDQPPDCPPEADPKYERVLEEPFLIKKVLLTQPFSLYLTRETAVSKSLGKISKDVPAQYAVLSTAEENKEYLELADADGKRLGWIDREESKALDWHSSQVLVRMHKDPVDAKDSDSDANRRKADLPPGSYPIIKTFIDKKTRLPWHTIGPPLEGIKIENVTFPLDVCEVITTGDKRVERTMYRGVSIPVSTAAESIQGLTVMTNRAKQSTIDVKKFLPVFKLHVARLLGFADIPERNTEDKADYKSIHTTPVIRISVQDLSRYSDDEKRGWVDDQMQAIRKLGKAMNEGTKISCIRDGKKEQCVTVELSLIP